MLYSYVGEESAFDVLWGITMEPPSLSAVELIVNNEEGVIILRQEVRQLARKLGIGLPQQAKITTAISEVIRKLLGAQQAINITISVAKQQRCPALQILCYVADEQKTSVVANHMQEIAESPSIRVLVDEVALSDRANSIMLLVWVPIAGGAA